MKCNQHGCEAAAAFRFTWPGRDESGICDGHAPKLRAIAGAMGMHLQLAPVHVDSDLDALVEREVSK